MNQRRVFLKNLLCLDVHLELLILANSKVNATAYYILLFYFKEEIETTPLVELPDIKLAIEKASVVYLHIPYFVPYITLP